MTSPTVWLDEARRHPRHLLLGGLVVGLALGAVSPGAWPVPAVAAALAVAGAILEYREEHGGFGSVEELGQVPGIGEKRLAALREKVRV